MCSYMRVFTVLIKIDVMRAMPLYFKKSNLGEDVELQKYITLRVKIKANVNLSGVLEFFCRCLILAKTTHIWYSFSPFLYSEIFSDGH